MTDNTVNNKPKFIRKPGRTLLVQQTSDSFDSTVLENLEGLTSSYHTERSNSYFLTFESLSHFFLFIVILKEQIIVNQFVLNLLITEYFLHFKD